MYIQKFLSGLRFSSKKPKIQNLKIPTADSKVKKTDFNNLPPDLQKAVRAKKEAYYMEVPSQAEQNKKVLAAIIQQQRENLDEQEKKGFGEAERFCGGVVGVNAIAVGVLWAWPGALAMWAAGPLFNSAVGMGACLLGSNIAALICKQSLNLFNPDLKNVTMTESPPTYYAEAAIISIQIMLLASTQTLNWLPLVSTPQLLTGCSVSILSLLAYSYYQQKVFKKSLITGMGNLTTMFSILCSLYLILQLNMGEVEEYKQGKQRFANLWKMQKKTVTEEKINTVINQEE